MASVKQSAARKKKAIKKAPARKTAKKAAAKKGAAKTSAVAKTAAKKGSGKGGVKRGKAIAKATAAELEIDHDVLEFIEAIASYRKEHSRPFPSWSEVLHILRDLGYRKSR